MSITLRIAGRRRLWGSRLLPGFFLFLLALTSSSAPAGLQFGPASLYTVGAGPRAVAVGDINNDGRLDLVTANFTANTVSVLLGQGDGTFTNFASYATGLSPTFICMGNLNGDTNLDVATANYNDDTVSLLLGHGDGTFSAATNINVGDRPSAVAIEDFNADGSPDLAVPNTIDSTVTVLTNRGDATFEFSATNGVAGGSLHSLASSDFNGDGRPDLVVTSGSSGTAGVLLGHGGGTFESPSNYPATYGFAPAMNLSHAAIGDFNADGRPDLVTANYVAGSTTFLKGQADGTFVVLATNTVGSSPHMVAVADFDGDGNLDFVTANNGANNLSVRTGHGDGTFKPATYFSAGASPQFATVGDFNGDGKPDIVTAPQIGSSISVLLNESLPALEIKRTGASIRVSWPRWEGYRLEWKEGFSPGNGWSPVVDAPFVTDGRNSITNSIESGTRFYRLVNP